MKQISDQTLDFLRELNQNNNREWFIENKKRYQASRKDFIEFIQNLIAKIAEFDSSISQVDPKKAVFRIYRDTRFSKDKTPYKPNFGAHIVAHNAKPHDRAGYYLHIEPGKSFLASGAYMPPGPWIKKIRQNIVENPTKFKKILADKEFKSVFNELEGEKLKTAPRDFPKDHPEIELLRHKSFLAVQNLNESIISKEYFLNHCSDSFKVVKPFKDFLNQGLD